MLLIVHYVQVLCVENGYMFVVFVCTVHSHRRQRGTSHHCTVFPYLVIGAPYRALTDKI